MTVAVEPVLMTFGTDESIERVLSAIADQDWAEHGGVLSGRLNAGDSDAFFAALVDADHAELTAVFRSGAEFCVSAVITAVLFESLVDFALAQPKCAADPERQERAWSWAADIALNVAGVELV